MSHFPRTPPNVISRLYEMLEIVHRVCKQHAITYWVIGGTLLGLARHGHIIPWDDDADVGIFDSEEERLFSCMTDYLKGTEVSVIRSEHGLKVKCMRQKGVGVDVFIYKRDGDRVVLAKNVSAKCWPRDYFLTSETDALENRKLGPIVVSAVPNGLRYCKQVYGENCMEEASLDFCHLENKPHVDRGVHVSLATAMLQSSSTVK